MVTSLFGLRYELFKRGRRHWGRLQEDAVIHTGITGHEAELDGTLTPMRASLHPDGILIIYAGSEWDFGSGPAVNTPGMLRASLVHDAFCHFTNLRLVPWSVRAEGDRLFRTMIKHYQPDYHPLHPMRLNRWWRWGSVSLYSQLVGRWKDRVDLEQ